MGLVRFSCFILFLDFLNHVLVVSETLAILRIFCHRATRVYMSRIGSQTRTYTYLKPSFSRVNTGGIPMQFAKKLALVT